MLYFIIYCLYEQGTELANIFLINYLQFVNHPCITWHGMAIVAFCFVTVLKQNIFYIIKKHLQQLLQASLIKLIMVKN